MENESWKHSTCFFCCIHNVPSAQRGVKKLLTTEANNPDANVALFSHVNRKSQSKSFDLFGPEPYADCLRSKKRFQETLIISLSGWYEVASKQRIIDLNLIQT